MNPRSLLEATFRAALSATDPARLVGSHLHRTNVPAPDAVLAVGKAAPGMLRAALEAFPGVPFLAVMPDGLSVPAAPNGLVFRAGHPVPDEHSVQAAEAALKLVATLKADQHLLALVSGGGSALMAAPWGVTLAQKQALTTALLASGASIGQLNTVRKHLSRVKGGRLAAATPARITALLLSDVVGDDLTTVAATTASGPTAPDPSTFAQALEVLDTYSLAAPEARAHLERGVRGVLEETPKPGAQAFERVTNTVIGSGRLLLEAAQEFLGSQGTLAVIVSDRLTGEAKDAAARHAALIQSIRASHQRPLVLLSGGETTVTLGPHHGLGGRNHEFALALLIELGPCGVYALCAGSDGLDGNSGAAGAFLTPDSLTRAQRLGLNAAESLSKHDSGSFFAALQDQLVIGPTGTNLNDFQAVWVGD